MATAEQIMAKLHCTKEEALDIIANDKAIDRGERVFFDLPPEKEKAAKKMANVQGHTVYKFTKRERKANLPKQEIISNLYQFLVENGMEKVEILNKERQISFVLGENTFEVTLTQKRKPKN